MSSTLTAAFLFVDVVGSTDLLHRLGDDANDELRERYTPVLRDAVVRHGGTEVKGLGDGLMAAFSGSTAEAVAAAIAMQQGVDRLFRADPLLRIQLRIGLSVGEAVYHEHDWSGVPVVEAARLEAAALPGTILANELVQGVVGTRGGFEFVPVGVRQLKGFPEPLRCVEVVWDAPDILPEVPLVAELTSLDGLPLVGRAAELDLLLDAWKRTADRRSPEWVSVVGPAGSGTTRLAAELATIAHSDGGTVLHGRCEESPALPVQPWVRALRWWSASVPLEVLRDAVGEHAAILATVVPTLSTRLPELAAQEAPRDPDDLVDAVAEVLAGIARAGPLLMVLDQAQLVDDATRAILDRLVSAEGLALMVLTLERVDEEREPVLEAPTTVRLGPLDLASVHELVDAIARRHDVVAPLGRELAGRVLRDTHGSPRGIVEVAERLITSGAFEASGSEHDEAVRSALAATSPYKGLLPYQEDDAELYFGRNDHIAALLSRLGSNRFLVVTGASGSGKSSLVRAGLIPALARGALAGSELWTTVVFTPGARPLTELAWAFANVGGGRISDVLAALERGTSGVATVLGELGRANPEGRVVLVIDQFEELFTQGSDESERRNFVDAILHAAAPEGRIMVVAVVRGDFYGHSASIPGLGAAFEMSTFVVGPMNDDDIRSVIQGPASAAGLRLEPGLVDLMIRDVAAEPGALALLSHALYETWKRRENGELTVAGYRDSGGVRGAIARTAEGVFVSRLDPDQQQLAREVFLRLTEPGEGTEDTRRRASRAELEALTDSPSDLARLLEELTASRLLTVSADSVDVAHEALIREWPRLRSWLDEDRARLRSLRHLTHAAREWNEGGREPTDLYGPSRLETALAAVDEHRITVAEQEFLDASRAEIKRAESRDARHQRNMRRSLVGLCVALVALLAASIWAFGQRDVADTRAVEARARTQEANFQRLLSASQSLRGSNRNAAHLLASEAIEERDTAASRSALLGALQTDRSLLFQLPITRDARSSTLVGDDLLVYGATDGRVRIVDLGAERRVSFAVPLGDVVPGTPTPVLVADDTTRRDRDPVLVARSDDGRIWRIDHRTKAATGLPIETGRPIVAVASSARLDLVAAAAVDGAVTLWRISTGAPVGTIAGSGTPAAAGMTPRRAPPPEPVIEADGVDALAFSPVVDEVLLQRPGGRLQRYDTVTLQPRSGEFGGEVRGVPPEPGHVVYSPDGTIVVSYDSGRRAQQQAFDVATGTTLWSGRNHYVPAAFRSNDAILTLDERGQLVELSPRTGDVEHTVVDTQFGAGATGLHLSGDGSTVTLVSSGLQLVGRWSLRGEGLITHVVGDGPATPIEMSPSGERVLALHGNTDSGIGRLAVWESPSGKLVTDEIPMASAVFAGSDDRLVGVLLGGSIGYYDLRSGRTTPLPIDVDDVSTIAVSPEGHVLTGRTNGIVQFYDESGGRAFDELNEISVSGQVTGLRFDRTGDRLMVASPGQVTLFEWATRRRVGPPVDRVESAVFLPDSDKLLAARKGRGIQLVDPTTRNSTTVQLEGIEPELQSLDVSRDGKLLSVTSAGDEVQLFDLEAGAPLGVRVGASQRADTRFTADGSRLISGGDHGLEFWDLRPDRWRDASCRLTSRNLTSHEWSTYLPDAGRRTPTCPQWPLS